MPHLQSTYPYAGLASDQFASRPCPALLLSRERTHAPESAPPSRSAFAGGATSTDVTSTSVALAFIVAIALDHHSKALLGELGAGDGVGAAVGEKQGL